MNSTSDLIKEGKFADVKAEDGSWKICKILQVQSEGISFICEGSSFVYNLPSSRFAVFRKHTHLNPISQICMKDWRFTSEEFEENANKVQWIVEKSFIGLDQLELIQFLRGEVIVFVENLIEFDYGSETGAIEKVVKFFELVLKMIVMFYERLAGNGNLFDEVCKDSELITGSYPHALASCLFDLIGLNEKLLNLNPRCNRIFTQIYASTPSYEFSDKIINKSEYCPIFLHMVDYFVSIEGFDKLASLVEKDLSCPISLLNRILLHIFKDFIQPEIYDPLNLVLMKGVIARIESLNDRDIKLLEVETVQMLFNKGLENEGDVEAGKRILINLNLKFLKSPYLEKRIKAINEICSYIEGILENLEKVQEVSHILDQAQVLKEILEDRPHIEVLKRSLFMFKILSICHKINEKECKILLNLVKTGNKIEIQTGYKIIEEIYQYLDEVLQDQVYQKLESFEPDSINFLALTSLSIKNYEKTRSFRIESYFKKVLLEENHFSRVVEVVECLKKLYNCEQGRDCLILFLNEFPSILESNLSIIQMIKLVSEILLNLDSDQIKQYASQGMLKEKLLKNLFMYLECESDTSAWAFSRTEHISYRLKLLGYIMFSTSYEVHLKTKEISILWEKLVKNPQNPNDVQIFLNYIGGSGIKEAIINNPEKVFKKFFLNPKMFGSKLNFREYRAFHIFFLKSNEESNLIVEKSSLKGVKSSNILGIEKLFEIYLNSSKEYSRFIDKSMFNIFTQYDQNIYKRIPEIFQHHLALFIKSIDMNQDEQVDKALEFLCLLLEVRQEDQTKVRFLLYLDPIIKEIYLPSNTIVRNVRKVIAEIVAKPLSQIAFKIGDVTFTALSDFHEFKFKPDQYIQLIEENAQYVDFDPKELLTHSELLYVFVFQNLLKNKKSQEKFWKFIKNLPVRPQFSDQLRVLVSNPELPEDPYEYFHCFTLFKVFSQDQTWLAGFIDSQIRVNFLEFVLKNRRTAEFLMVQDELYIEILSYLNIPETLHILILSDILEVYQKSIMSLSVLEDLIKFYKNLQQILDYYISNHKTLFISETSKIIDSLIEISMQVLSTLKYKSSVYKVIEKSLKSLIFDTDSIGNCYSAFFNALYTNQVELNPSSKFFWKFLLCTIKSGEISMVLLNQGKEFIMTQLQSLKEETADCNQSLRYLLKILSNIQTYLKSPPVTDLDFESFLQNYLLGCQDNSSSSICKNKKTRSAAYRYLLSISSPSTLQILLQQLSTFSSTLCWRSSKTWSIYFNPREKLKKYSGLRNLGNTCYMNSLFQQLYSINSFRQSLLASTSQDPTCAVFQLKKLFTKLLHINSPFNSTKSFCANFYDYEGRPVNPMEQMDVDEFYCRLMDRLENELRGSELGHLVQEHFGLSSAVEMISECGDRSERQELMLSVPIEVKNKKDLIDSLRTFVKGEVMTAENAYFCETCSKKVTSTRRTSFKSLPNFLVFTLRRFEFNYDFMQRSKLNDYFEFPFELDMKEFSTEYLNNFELAEDAYYDYRLKGVVVHVGRAEHGHYYSFVKDGEDWIEFNDTLVSDVKVEVVKDKGFGKNVDAVASTAYLLVYERKEKFEGFSKKNEKDLNSLNVEIDKNYVLSKNYKHWMKKIVLSYDYMKFQIFMCKRNLPVKVTLDYLLTVLVRIERNFKEKVYLLKAVLERLDSQDADYILEIVSSEQGLLEYFLTCPSNISRKMIVALVQRSLELLEIAKVDFYFGHFLAALASLNTRSIQCEYLQVIYLFSIKSRSKALEFEIPDQMIRLITGSQITLNINAFKTDLLGYANKYKFLIFPSADTNNTSRWYSYEIIRHFIADLSEEVINFLKSNQIRDFLLRNIGSKDLRAYVYLYRDLLNENVEESAHYVLSLMSLMHESNNEIRDSYRLIISQFLEKHKFRVEILQQVLEFYLTLIPESNADDFEFYVMSLLKLLKNLDFEYFSSILDDEKIQGLVQTAESLRYILFNQIQYPNQKIEKVLEFIRNLPRIEFPVDAESGFPESELVVDNFISIYDSGRKSWFQGKIVDIVENLLILIKYSAGNSKCWALKLVSSDEIYPKSS